VGQVLHQPQHDQQADELARRHADQQRQGGKPDAGDQVVEQVVAGVRPEGHLPLGVVDAVQRPPPAKVWDSRWRQYSAKSRITR
jgi:phage baseplate assembly protein gpV